MSVYGKKNEFPYATTDILHWKPSGYRNKVYDNILHTIGDTPLVRLNRIPRDHGLQCEIYAKCEFLNPGGSIKDRMSYTMMVQAEKAGLAMPGTHFVEPTSGNTGIGISLATAVHGYGCTIVTPDKNSDEKINTIRLLGADVVQTPSIVPFEDPRSFVSVVKRIREENPRAITCDQYSNAVNPATHYHFTAEEILSALGHVDMIVMGAGTGGTVSGVAHKVKERCPDCIIVVVDPQGSIIFGKGEPRLFFVEGIGGDFVPEVLDKSVADKVIHPNDKQAFNMAREVIRKEGLLCGGSSGAAMYSAIQAAKELNMGAGKRVVVILPDGIRNYMTKFVTDQWMEANLFMEPPKHTFTWWNHPISNLNVKAAPTVKSDRPCSEAVSAMGSQHSVTIVTDHDGFFVGAISKDSLRNEATNPKKEEHLHLREPISLHLIKKCCKLVENEGKPTVGLLSRILDITPFVVIVERRHQSVHNIDKGTLLPKGIITGEIMFDYIINHQ